MDIANLINHPENLNKETLYDLRSMLALYPYYQPARILLLQNLFLLHDPTSMMSYDVQQCTSLTVISSSNSLRMPIIN